MMNMWNPLARVLHNFCKLTLKLLILFEKLFLSEKIDENVLNCVDLGRNCIFSLKTMQF